MNDAPDPDDPPRADYRRFDDEAGLRSAITRLLACEGRELRIFDPDLAGLRINSPERIEQLKAFLVASRTRRIYIAVHDTDHLTRYCPRMMDLLARYTHAMQINRTNEEIREIQDSFLVLDSRHYVRRPVARLFRGAVGLHDEIEAQAMRARFGEIWAASCPGVSSTTVGL